jgi:hypothetical protein
VKSLMQRMVDPAQMAGWIVPPERGISSLPIDCEYVRLEHPEVVMHDQPAGTCSGAAIHRHGACATLAP